MKRKNVFSCRIDIPGCLMFLLASFGYSCVSAQKTNFYYTFNKETISLTKKQGSYLVEFTGKESPQPAPGVLKSTNTYIVEDTLDLKKYGIPYFVSPVYNTSNGIEMCFKREILVEFLPTTAARIKAGIISANKLELISSSTTCEMYQVGGDALEASKKIYETGEVKYCHPNFIIKIEKLAYIPTDPYFVKQWYLHNTGQGTNDGRSTTINADIDAPEAWDITKGRSTVTIAVVDEGITSNHPDLPNTRQIRLSGSNFDVTSIPNDPSPTVSSTAGNNHGNACAGIIAATQDNQGISGIAPNCKIMPVKITYSGAGGAMPFVQAINFADVNNADIINCSWGTEGGNKNLVPAIVNAIQAAIDHGKIVVFAAGNSARKEAGNKGALAFPANADIKDLIVVVASDRNNEQAYYSPYDNSKISVSAPSHKAFSDQTLSSETYNIWSIDIPGAYGYNSWRDYLPVQFPAIGEYLPNTSPVGTNAADYTGRFGGTSAAAPQVSGVAALMKSVNPCLSQTQIKDLLQTSADKIGPYNYYWNPFMPGYAKELGYGKLNAYKAVKAAQAAYSSKLDLYTKDNIDDIGTVGVNGTGGRGDKSPDIWVRNADDGIEEHQNPEYTAGVPCIVYVRVRNKSCVTSTGSEKLSLYWTKSSGWSSWPTHWDGSLPSIGNKIGSETIPVLSPGTSTIIKFSWYVLDPAVYGNTLSCLLSRIEGVAADPITVYPDHLPHDISENNNISVHNVTVVNNVPGIRGGRVLIGNVLNYNKALNITLRVPRLSDPFTTIITNDAEVKLTFDVQGWGILQQSGQLNQSGITILPNRQIIISQPDVTFSNIMFPANLRIPIDIEFNFLNQTNNNYEYAISQAFTDSPSAVLGTETYLINNANNQSNKSIRQDNDHGINTISGVPQKNQLAHDYQYDLLNVENQEKTGNIYIFPNPASHFISLKNSQEVNWYELMVYNALGQEVMHIYKSKTTNDRIDINGLNNGAYTIAIFDKNKHQTGRAKFFKQSEQ